MSYHMWNSVLYFWSFASCSHVFFPHFFYRCSLVIWLCGLVMSTAEVCGSQNIAFSSVRGFWPQIHDHVRRQMLCRIRFQSASPRLAFWPLPHRPQPQLQPCVQSMWAWLGHWSTVNDCSCGAWSVTGVGGLTEIKRVVSTIIASAHCARRVSLSTAELELMIRISPRPRIFKREPSTSVRGRCEKLADVDTFAHLWSTVVLLWHCCHHHFSARVQPKFIIFYLDGPELALLFSSSDN